MPKQEIHKTVVKSPKKTPKISLVELKFKLGKIRNFSSLNYNKKNEREFAQKK